MISTFQFFLYDLFEAWNIWSWLAVAPVVLCAVAGLLYAVLARKQFGLILKNLRRNLVRTGLTAVATMVLVIMITLIWTVIFFIDLATREQSNNFKLIVTERWQLPSQLPLTHADYLNPSKSQFLDALRGLYGPNDFMTWSFYGGTTDPGKMTRENLVFCFVMNPDHIKPMMDDLADLPDEMIDRLRKTRNGVLLGKDRLASINKRVGERFKLTSINYKGIDLEFEVVGELPAGRYDTSGIMNEAYFNNELDSYKQRNRGNAHPLDQKRLNLVWIRVKDKETFSKVQNVVENAPEFADRPVKCETASAGVGTFLDAYKDLLWGMKFLLVPAIIVSMSLVVANAISISVRERRTEMAVLKVLGFRPNQILRLILGESLLVGGLSGLLAGTLAYVLVNVVVGGIPFPIAFFPRFMVPFHAFFWGAALGLASGFLGSFLPAWSARSVKVSEVFAKVA